MDAEKRKIIVREIDHWRRSKLLPAQYCDFLLNLYVDETTEKPASILGVSSTAVTNSSWKIWLSILSIVTALALSALNFNSFGLPLQIGISALFVIICYFIAKRQFERAPLLSFVFCGIASIALLLLGIYIMNQAGIQASTTYVGYLAFCSCIWLFNGLIARMAIFQICGWFGLIATYGWLLMHKLTQASWFSLELSWLPVSVVLIWMAWLAHHTNKQAASVLMLVGGLVWFIPEAMSFVMDVEMSAKMIQLSFTAKLVSVGAALFLLRKKWVEWVM
ncbi:hypothetical protein [Paenibacillus roseipurpureus]|uniref:DUF2157 domain-containing protein n=1 Tax=Paenibacillus roseopurpureus TaxID=2918901 RepID=A0AA96RKI7_9BACL|nr:hypothetical protein [Paenibacillus sp. MBLB1832]WNR46398.1 hypothetical protein MJB10_09980 [Paenibacillus sp. MBLB1832]